MGFEVAGRVTEFLVKEGDEIEKDQVLARLDARDYEAEMRAAQADVKKAESDLERNLAIKARNPGAISDEQIETAQRGVEVAQARLEIAQKAVEDTELKAPFAGRMARKLVPDYANVQAKEPVLILQDISILEIEVSVPERDFAQRRPGELTKEQLTERLQPKVIISAVPDHPFPGRIKEYATTADPITRTFAVTLNFDPDDRVNVLPGMTARVVIVANADLAWSVPSTAVQEDTQGPYVWKVDPQEMTVSRCFVQLGDGMAGDRVRLKRQEEDAETADEKPAAGVQAGDMIAISGILQLREGMKVRKFEMPSQQ